MFAVWAACNRDRGLVDEQHWCSSVFGCRNACGLADKIDIAQDGKSCFCLPAWREREPSRTGRRQQQLNILAAENEVSDLEATFAAPDFHAKQRSEIFELEMQLKTARNKVAHLYARRHELELMQSVPSP